ncbi:MAG: hypothetical protein A2821_03035 [Candidatus Magasanikbacteria bacterium RIFCSPHIGHO2_01_FULL_41_23]|uniref:Dehydrogenase n=1 Tax=Candidatus Magasanikbacteria bacterium RIFCSPLOWO2_01_FULL_40_15 TaxID=1798686 RepID=A0A1F6N3A8_9BACT|nr:MAG: hypothetical protein A2821_03035 [Candidatus Magasanikbacteria bacterium RIFCSPHIGHO2_01_FULL_41_23]OGH67313.1 MAG: hypothetical protein A3C66_01050 [Candidatus Magasanikbacteria bacterium RIFCSPHIGHO2_02_FULL_41_35]OGH76538.1 MAG: hypothetical protein A3F22_00260 [Candidatus Magasanikbacteria bacterium RIFCSPHIGHO2_12_FULL_41_16]OGH78476.1 MAG: hypothetical protein A2983_03095 [Candidatus Magasanikbacteria bacterium RIFCSPLOWO2_01_FULL_40_15]
MILSNKHAIITGGSKGIGRAIAKAFVQRGATILIVARSLSELQATQAELGSDSVSIYQADISQPLEVDNLFVEIKKKWGDKLDILINAAAIYGSKGFLEDTNVEDWLQTIMINTYGTMLMTRGALPLMKSQIKGRIINFSGGGEGSFPRFSAYATSKGAIIRFTESIAEEVKPWDITVNAIAPGPVNTSLLQEVLDAGPEIVGTDFYERSKMQQKEGGVSPEKAGELCLWLASKQSDGLTGKVLSAVWDKYEDIPQHLEEIMNSDVYNWRRIKPKDRGYEW